MATFLVDLTSLDENNRDEAFQLMNDYSEMAFRVISNGKMEAAQVVWTSPEDFESSPVFPKGCQCTRISD